MLNQEKAAKAEVFDSNVGSALLLGGLAFFMLATANGVIVLTIWSLFLQQKASITPDMYANAGFLLLATIGALLVDAQALMEMFGKPSRVSDKNRCSADPTPDAQPGESPNPIVALYGIKSWERTICLCTTTVNWLASHGLLCSSLKLGITNPLSIEAMATTPALHDLVSGDLLLNPLIREWNWEALYGMCCGLYLGVYFSVLVCHRANFNLQLLAPKAICYFACGIGLMTLTGFFRVRQYTPGWIGPRDGFWLLFCQLLALYMAYDQWHKTHKPKGDCKKVSEFQEGILALADRWRGWKPVTVFALTTFLSLVFAYAAPMYPLVIVLTFCLYWRSHRMDRGWNKMLFFLTITHQVIHYFVHSYRTLEDQPLLWIDKFVHFLYAVIAAQQFHDNKELLSKDPLVRAFNYINIFIWIPGDVIAMYITGFHGPSDVYLKHLISWGGYCLSTGTAMAYVNNDIQEDSAEDSSRRFIVNQPGVSGHGIQIFQALLFAVVYIVSAGGNPEYGNLIEYVYDFAGHLYTGYGTM